MKLRRIRICFLADTVEPRAGVENQVVETVSRIDQARFETHLCCFETGPRLQSMARYGSVSIFPMTSVYTFNGLRQILRLRRYLASHHIDIVHAFTSKTAIVGVVAARLSNCPVIITSRLNTGYWYTPFYLQLFRYLNRHTTRLFANSHGAKRAALELEHAPTEKIDVVYNGVDLVRYGNGNPSQVEPLGIPDHARVVGIVANLRPVKDHELFLRAAQVVARNVPGVAFLLVGEGPLRSDLSDLARELDIAQQVFFTDGDGAVPDYLSRMCIGCLSSKGEGFSNAILEYMAAGLPTVATDVGGNGEAIDNGKTGYLVRDRTPEAFADPIIKLLSDERLRTTMGKRSYERCQSLFNVDHCIRQLEDYYAALIDERPLNARS
jgi:glycosyltransferase involved in cell wall biosynthesis